MDKTVTASEARNNFFAMLQEVQTPGVVIYITHEGRPAGALISAEELEGWKETMDIMSDPEEVSAIEQGMREKEKGEVVTLEEFTKKLAA